MTVKELIEELKDMPQDAQVEMCDGYCVTGAELENDVVYITDSSGE